jgi:hypothetical protein
LEKDPSRKDAKHAKFGEIRRFFFFVLWRPFDFAQDMLGALNHLEVVLKQLEIFERLERLLRYRWRISVLSVSVSWAAAWRNDCSTPGIA